MATAEDKTDRLQFSLKVVFGVITVFAIELWLLQQGIGFYFFVPLLIAIALELAGLHEAANYAAVATVILWLFGPCLIAVVM
jgi:hypothetical protein